MFSKAGTMKSVLQGVWGTPHQAKGGDSLESPPAVFWLQKTLLANAMAALCVIVQCPKAVAGGLRSWLILSKVASVLALSSCFAIISSKPHPHFATSLLNQFTFLVDLICVYKWSGGLSPFHCGLNS